MERRVAEQHEGCAHDSESARELRQFQAGLAREHVARGQPDDAFYRVLARGLRGDDGVQSCGRDQDASHERERDRESTRVTEQDHQE